MLSNEGCRLNDYIQIEELDIYIAVFEYCAVFVKVLGPNNLQFNDMLRDFAKQLIELRMHFCVKSNFPEIL